MPTDEKITALAAVSTLASTDLVVVVDDVATTPVTKRMTVADLETMIETDVGSRVFSHYNITPSVSANDLILALKHEDGTDPSATRPLYFKIGSSLRAVTAALSVTKADGTSWANLGSAEFATKETDLFPYLVWNTNLTPDAVDIFWSRIPYGRLYSDFSATTTNEKYAAINATAPAATDECINIGRFAATLSAGAGYTWTVPTFTNANLIHAPTLDTRALNWYPQFSASGSLTFTSVSIAISSYEIRGQRVIWHVRGAGTLGGTADSAIFYTPPFTPKEAGFNNSIGTILFADGSATPSLFGGSYWDLNAAKIGNAKYNFANWHNSGTGTIDSNCSTLI